jgi:hypothetical protein
MENIKKQKSTAGELTNEQLERILKRSSNTIDVPGSFASLSEEGHGFNFPFCCCQGKDRHFHQGQKKVGRPTSSDCGVIEESTPEGHSSKMLWNEPHSRKNGT